MERRHSAVPLAGYDEVMRYEEAPALSRPELQRQFESGSPEEVAQALVSAAFHEADWGWVQDWCIRLADHTDSNVRRVAIVSLGHIARVHRALDLGRVLPILALKAKEEDLALKAKEEDLEGTVEDALSDIHMFIPGCKR